MMEKKSKGLTIASIIFLCLDSIILLIGAFVINRFYVLLNQFDIEFSTVTHVVFSFRYIFVILALILIAKEFIARKSITFTINLVVLIMLFGSVPFVVIGLLQPMQQLTTIEETNGSPLCDSNKLIDEIFDETEVICIGTITKATLFDDFTSEGKSFINRAECRIEKILKGDLAKGEIEFLYKICPVKAKPGSPFSVGDKLIFCLKRDNDFYLLNAHSPSEENIQEIENLIRYTPMKVTPNYPPGYIDTFLTPKGQVIVQGAGATIWAEEKDNNILYNFSMKYTSEPNSILKAKMCRIDMTGEEIVLTLYGGIHLQKLESDKHEDVSAMSFRKLGMSFPRVKD